MRKKKQSNDVIGKWLMSLPRLFCWACGKPFDSFAHAMNVDHIIGGSGRKNEECNLAILGACCHSSKHGLRVVVDGKLVPRVTLADVLRAKRKYDKANWNPERLKQLRGQALPDID